MGLKIRLLIFSTFTDLLQKFEKSPEVSIPPPPPPYFRCNQQLTCSQIHRLMDCQHGQKHSPHCNSQRHDKKDHEETLAKGCDTEVKKQ